MTFLSEYVVHIIVNLLKHNLFIKLQEVALNKTWTNQIKNKLYLPITIMKYVKYIFVVVGIVFIILAMFVNYNSVKTVEITPKY